MNDMKYIGMILFLLSVALKLKNNANIFKKCLLFAQQLIIMRSTNLVSAISPYIFDFKSNFIASTIVIL